MTETTITRAQLAEAVYQEVGLSRNESAQMVDIMLEEVSQALIREELVKLSGFGTFQVPGFERILNLCQQFGGIGGRQIQINNPLNDDAQSKNQANQNRGHPDDIPFNELLLENVVNGVAPFVHRSS
ncbi:MAG: hypothetical protein EBS53_17670 [Bacteroidetes bacterium]|nr:hypothetical protein [Bacteroidota bacterium]